MFDSFRDLFGAVYVKESGTTITIGGIDSYKLEDATTITITGSKYHDGTYKISKQ
jgi:hypothetical protein